VKDATQLGLVEHQGLMSRVVKVYDSHECPRVRTKLSHCWDYSTEVSILYCSCNCVVDDNVLGCDAVQFGR
jgi:hypothetical protein